MKREDLGTPTRETEKFRMWVKDKSKDNGNLKEYAEEEGFEVELEDGNKIKCVGFTEYTKDDKLMFAYKFKHEDKFIIYYNPSKDENFLNLLKSVALVSGYNLQDMEETLKSIREEVKLFEDKEQNDE